MPVADIYVLVGSVLRFVTFVTAATLVFLWAIATLNFSFMI
jgi:hypothetical protein